MKISRSSGRLLGAASVLAILASGCTAEEDAKAADKSAESPKSDSAKSQPSEMSAADKAALVKEAERLVLADLGDAPIWKGTTAKGTYVSEKEVCVDRTFGATTSLAKKGENAGYVVVTFPKKSLGEPQDGLCKDKVDEPELPPVAVPKDLQDEDGLMTRDQFGDEWPLTVDYGVVQCDNDSVTFTAPNGTEYAVNGTAQTHHPELPKIDPIWAPDPDMDGLKINIGPIIDKGLDLC